MSETKRKLREFGIRPRDFFPGPLLEFIRLKTIRAGVGLLFFGLFFMPAFPASSPSGTPSPIPSFSENSFLVSSGEAADIARRATIEVSVPEPAGASIGEARNLRIAAARELKLGRNEEVGRLFEKAVSLLTEARRSSDAAFSNIVAVELADTLVEMADFYMSAGEIPAVIGTLEKACGLYSQVLSPSHPKILIPALHLARFLMVSGRSKEALERYDQILRTIRDFEIADSKLRSEAFLGSSLALLAEKKNEEAAMALALYTKELAKETPVDKLALSRGQMLLGEVRLKLGAFGSALESYDAAIAGFAELEKPPTAELALVCVGAATAARGGPGISTSSGTAMTSGAAFRKRLKKAEELVGALYDEAKTVPDGARERTGDRTRDQEEERAEEQMAAVRALMGLARLYRELGASVEAEKLFDDSIEFAKRSRIGFLIEEAKTRK
jgi:tetratricopeptide (TPR) repeat protein